MITPEQLDEWQRIADLASPGPWEVLAGGYEVVWWCYDGKYQPGYLPFWASDIDRSDGNPFHPYAHNFNSLEFVAAARTAVPALIAEVRRLRAELSDQHCFNEGLQEHVGDLREAIKPFAEIVKGSIGNITTERLSFRHWHDLVKAFDEAAIALDPVQGPPEEIGTGLYRMADGDIVGNEPESPEF